MAFEWVAGLFQADNQTTRGLSGGSAQSVALDDSNPYYNYRLRRHRAEGDLAADPGLLWYTSPYVKRRTGLGTHVAAELGDGTANYTDVLVIMNREDYHRSGADWQYNAVRTLQQEFDNFCRRENFGRLHGHRPLGVRILEDGSPSVGGHHLALGRGEFITGLLPNLYTGPVRGSYPVIGVYVNLPGVWEGYEEVGRLYNDQILFTIGNHWLDNFCHPSLKEAALYRLRQYPDGTFVHIVNPDLQDQYQVTSTNQGGASVLTLATRMGQPLAYMVLAVIDPPGAQSQNELPPVQAQPSPVAASHPNIHMPAAPAQPAYGAPYGQPGQPGLPPAQPGLPPGQPMHASPAHPGVPGHGVPGHPGMHPAAHPPQQPMAQPPGGYGHAPYGQPAAPVGPAAYPHHHPSNGVPSIAPPMMVEEQAPRMPPRAPSNRVGGRTIIPDAPSERIFTLQERGALLQKVHFSAFMQGYDVFLGSRGELGTHVENPAATFQVRKRSVSLVAHVEGVVVGGRQVPAGIDVPVDGDVRIDIAGEQLEYRDLRGISADGWPYVGEIRRPASSTYMLWGEDYQVGRSRECRVVLPDEPRNDNIHWKPSVAEGATIRARTGEIPKTRFYTDSIMVASEHATVDLRAETPHLVCNARHCYIYVRRGDEVMALYPATSAQEPKETGLLPGDEILIGNCLFHVGFTPSEEGVVPAPAPRIDLRSDSLAGVVDDPYIPDLDADSDELPPPAVLPEPGPVEVLQMPAEGDAPLDNGVDHSMLVQIEPPDEGDDESTSPGMVLPREGAAWDEGGWDEAPPGAIPRDDTDLSMEGALRTSGDVGGWDGEDWADEDSSPGQPAPDFIADAATELVPSNGAGVPTPFPEMEDPLPPIGEEIQFERTDEVRAARRTLPREVLFVDDAEAQFELGRPLHVILAGWMVNGEVLCGNHQAADLVIPENRIEAEQSFEPVDYFRLRVRGRKGHLSLVADHEVLIDGERPTEMEYEHPDDRVIDVIRRDDAGEEDFTVRLRITEDAALPDPRARFVAMDFNDPLAAALVTRGLPQGQPRTVDLEGIRMTLTYADNRITVSDYLASYRRGAVYRSFFVQKHGGRFKTAPEDGASFDVEPGDRLIVGHSVFLLRQE